MHFKFHLNSYHHNLLDIKIHVASYACDSLGVETNFPSNTLCINNQHSERKVARRENDIMGYHLRCPSSWEVIWDILFSGLYFLMDNNHGPLKVWNLFC